MTQLEYVIDQFIIENPRCTQADILASFAKPPDKVVLENVLEALYFQDHIQILPVHTLLFEQPLVMYYYSAGVLLNKDSLLSA